MTREAMDWPRSSPKTTDGFSFAGLTAVEAARRQDEYGPNEPAPARGGGGFAELAGQFANPLALVLIAAAVVSAVAGDPTGAAVIVAIVLVGAAINFTQTYRSARAVRR